MWCRKITRRSKDILFGGNMAIYKQIVSATWWVLSDNLWFCVVNFFVIHSFFFGFFVKWLISKNFLNYTFLPVVQYHSVHSLVLANHCMLSEFGNECKWFGVPLISLSPLGYNHNVYTDTPCSIRHGWSGSKHATFRTQPFQNESFDSGIQNGFALEKIKQKKTLCQLR